MSQAHDKLRARLKAYRNADELYHGPDPYDREESRYRALCEARARVGDVEQAEALLAEYDRLVAESTAARQALGEGWLINGATLAEGIERKTRALEGLNASPELTPADPMLPTVAVPRDLVEAIVDDLREGLAIERETGEALAELLGEAHG